MKPESGADQNAALDKIDSVRNPFGVRDVPEPNDREVKDFAARTKLDGSAGDENATAWQTAREPEHDTIEGNWSSRWNGGADPIIPGDTPDKWKQGNAEVRTLGERVYVHFDWNRGARRGLIDAKHDGSNRLVGKYINLTNLAIMRPWIGLIVDNQRIDGCWSSGRLDFRR